MKLQSVKTALLALAGLALLGHTAKAQQASAADGDLVLGVYQTSSSAQGYGDIYLVDLGNFTTLNLTPSSSNVTFSNINTANLTSIFGSALSQASFVIGGTKAASGSVSYDGVSVDKHAVLLTSAGTAPTTTTYTQVSPASSNIAGSAGLYGLLGSSGSGVTNLSSNETEVSQTGSPFDDTTLTSYQAENLTTGSSSFYLLNSGSTNGLAGQNTAVPTQLLGTFSWVGGNTLTFNAQAVPEPSAFALGFCAMLLFWVLKRRSSVV